MKPGTDQWMHHRFGNVQLVTLYVGKDKVGFHLHEDTLFNASLVFRKAFTSDFQEGSKRTMDLPEDDAGLFEHLILQELRHGSVRRCDVR